MITTRWASTGVLGSPSTVAMPSFYFLRDFKNKAAVCERKPQFDHETVLKEIKKMLIQMQRD
jgi:hypothetical protein